MERFDALVRPDREASAAMELISSDGELKELGLEGFNNSVELQGCDLSRSVGIFGPKDSGKSTLLNHLFGTSFPQRDPSTPRRMGMPTTRGVWIAKAQKEPFTLVMDLEGTDGGQDGTAFEKRSALFALAVAHTLLINMWCHDFGREHASYRPLLRTIFESVITMPMFSPPRKTTLLFVVRDMSSYDESLETPIKEDVQKIWEEVKKPEGRELTPLSDFFNVEYFPMSSYREKRDTFEKEVKQLRQKILNSISHGVDRQQWVVPASRFCSILKEKWTTIKQNDNLDLPAHNVMVATTRCEEIVKRTLQLFAQRIWKEAKRWLPPTWVMMGLTILAGLMLFLRVWNRIVFAVSVWAAVANVMGNVMSICGNILDKIELVPRAHQILISISHGGHGQWVSRFCSSIKEIWTAIKQNIIKHLPAHKIMVGSVRCQDIAKDKLESFASNQAWLDIQKAAETKVVLGFGADISSMLRDLLLEYDSEAEYFDEVVRNEKRQYLESEVLKLVHPAYLMILEHLRAEALKIFETGLEKILSEGGGFGKSVYMCRQSCVVDFDRRCSDAAIEQAKWDASKMKQELVRDIETQRLLVRTEKLPQVVDQCRERVSAKIGKRLNEVFRMGDVVSWAAVRKMVASESDAAGMALSSALVPFELDHATLAEMVGEIKHYARKVVEKRFKEEAKDILTLLQHRFIDVFQEEECSNRDAEVGKGKLREHYLKCLKLLSTMAVLRLDKTYDDVENVLISTITGPHDAGDPLDSTSWEKVPAEVTLITPAECKDIWKQFVNNVELSFARVKAARAKSEEFGHSAPRLPVRVILGIAVFRVLRYATDHWDVPEGTRNNILRRRDKHHQRIYTSRF